MNIDFIKGVIPPILTPIDQNELIDEAKLRKQIDFIIKGGVHGILLFGSNGEFYMVDEAEMKRGLTIAADHVKKRVPLYFGIGAIKTRKCVELAQMAKAGGADAISVLQPMFLKPNDDELYQHFKAIAQSVPDMPMLLYNNPGRVGYSMSSSLVAKLAADVKNIVGIKDSSGDMSLTAELIMVTDPENFRVLGGKDTLIYGTMAHGGAGAVATMANMFPELTCSIYEKYVAGDTAGSLKAQFKLTPLRQTLDKASFPVGTKDLSKLMGLDVGEPYLPSLSSKAAVLDLMKERIKQAGF
jgi:4-hydroxy-tetrahydrodipicolinate synthase